MERWRRWRLLAAAPASGPMLIYLIACAAPPTGQILRFVELAMKRGWNVSVTLTPNAVPFAGDLNEIEQVTGYPIRLRWRHPDQASPVPDPEAVVVAPATFNTINKWACGIADTVATATLCEAVGRGIPMVAAPCVNPDLARHPMFGTHLRHIEEWGVGVLYDPEAPQGERMAPWERIVEKLAELETE